MKAIPGVLIAVFLLGFTEGPAATADPPSPTPGSSLSGDSPPRSPRQREAEAILEEGQLSGGFFCLFS